MKKTETSPVLLFADKLPPQIGGMEVHGSYFKEHFSNHCKFPLWGTITKNREGKDIIYENGNIIDWNDRSLFPYIHIVFFNSGRWIEKLPLLRARFPHARFVYRTGGNEIIKAPLENSKIHSHIERQRFWTKTLNQSINLLITNSLYTEKRLKSLGLKCPMKRCVGGVETSLIKKKKPHSSYAIYSRWHLKCSNPYRLHQPFSPGLLTPLPDVTSW